MQKYDVLCIRPPPVHLLSRKSSILWEQAKLDKDEGPQNEEEAR